MLRPGLVGPPPQHVQFQVAQKSVALEDTGRPPASCRAMLSNRSATRAAVLADVSMNIIPCLHEHEQLSMQIMIMHDD